MYTSTERGRFLCSLIVFLFFTSPTLFSQRQHLLHENTFEEGAVDDAYLHGYENNQHCCSYSVQQSDEIKGVGSYVLRLEVRNTDETTSGSIRSEIVPDDESYPLNVDRWYGFKMYLKDWILDDYAGEHVFQWHPDNGTGSAALSLWTGSGRFLIVTNNTGTGSNNDYTDIGPVLSNQWVDFVFHVRWDNSDNNNSGILEVWKNGEKVIDRHNVKTAAITNYFKLGINKFGWPAGSITNRTLFFDEVRIGDEKATYEDVAPASENITFATLEGKISLQGRPVAPGSKWKVPLQVDIYTGDSSAPVAGYNIITDEYGNFSIPNLRPGTYTIAVKNSHTLKRVLHNQVVAVGSDTMDFGILTEGDVNNDNVISDADLSLLINVYNTAITDNKYAANADLNEDGVVDLLDLTLLTSNFNQAGETP